MTYYNREKVLQIMKEYHIYVSNLQEEYRPHASVGISIISHTPHSGALSNVVEQEAFRQMEELPVHAQMRTDKKYLDDRLYRVTDYADKEVLALRLEGMSIRDISLCIGKSRTYVNNKILGIAELISGQI